MSIIKRGREKWKGFRREEKLRKLANQPVPKFNPGENEQFDQLNTFIDKALKDVQTGKISRKDYKKKEKNLRYQLELLYQKENEKRK
jgi:hypothetical protein